jgi:hypothetical protein
VAPDVRHADGSRLRERFGSGHIIVSPIGVEAGIPVVVVGRGSPYGSERAWLVRPDGYVGASLPLDRFNARTWANDAVSLPEHARLLARKR